MADFLDFDSLELNVDEQVNGAKEHPLKGMKTGPKMAYVGGLLFACHADDNTLQKEERSLVIGVARSLGVGKEEVDELAEMVVGLTDKIGYLKEIVATLKDRKTILFFLCDMIKAMSADGVLNENAQKLVGAVEKLARLEDHDVAIVSNYQKALISLQGADFSALDFGDIELELEKALREWFLPDVANAKCVVKQQKTSKSKKTDGASVAKAKKPTRKKENQEKSAENTPIEAPVGQSNNDAILDKLAAKDFDNTVREAKISWLSTKVDVAFSDLMFAGLPNIWYKVMIPEKKKYNAHISMMVKEDEHVVQIDSTMFGSNKEGLVITDRALYYKNSFEVPHRIEWKSLKTCSRDGLYIDFGDQGRFACTIGSDEATDRFCQLVSSLIADLQANAHMLDV